MQDYRDEREHEGMDELPEVWHDFPDPWDGDHNIEYWIWDGVRLVPTTPEERARIQENARTEAARWRLSQLQQRERREARSLMRRLATATSWCGKCVAVAVCWLRSTRHRWYPRHFAAPTEGASVRRLRASGGNAADSEKQQDFQAPR